jgi:hypothetical protein
MSSLVQEVIPESAAAVAQELNFRFVLRAQVRAISCIPIRSRHSSRMLTEYHITLGVASTGDLRC